MKRLFIIFIIAVSISTGAQTTREVLIPKLESGIIIFQLHCESEKHHKRKFGDWICENPTIVEGPSDENIVYQIPIKPLSRSYNFPPPYNEVTKQGQIFVLDLQDDGYFKIPLLPIKESSDDPLIGKITTPKGYIITFRKNSIRCSLNKLQSLKYIDVNECYNDIPNNHPKRVFGKGIGFPYQRIIFQLENN